MAELVHTIIVGGGQAGLAMSYHLQQVGCEHVIFERARVAEHWRSQRWDSLVFQFPSWSIKLPGHDYSDGNPEGFAVTGVPVTYGKTGIRSFYIDETFVMRGGDNYGAPSTKMDEPLDSYDDDYPNSSRRRIEYVPQR